MFKSLCDICNCKYIGVYKSQHMKYHREQELSQQRRLLRLQAERTTGATRADEPEVTGKRRAAEK